VGRSVNGQFSTGGGFTPEAAVADWLEWMGGLPGAIDVDPTGGTVRVTTGDGFTFEADFFDASPADPDAIREWMERLQEEYPDADWDDVELEVDDIDDMLSYRGE